MSSFRVGLLASQLEICLSDSETPRDWDWAEDRCVDARLIHVAVWQWEEDRKYVQEEVVPLLQDARNEVLDVRDQASDDERDGLAVFANNIGKRIANLTERYLKGLKSRLKKVDDRLAIPKRSGRKKRKVKSLTTR